MGDVIENCDLKLGRALHLTMRIHGTRRDHGGERPAF